METDYFAAMGRIEERLDFTAQMCELLGGAEGSREDWIPPPAPVPANAEIA